MKKKNTNPLLRTPQEKPLSTAKSPSELSSLQSFIQLNKTLFNEEPHSPTSSSITTPPQQPHHQARSLNLQTQPPPVQSHVQRIVQEEPSLEQDDSCSNDSDPDRLEIEESGSEDAEENGYDMSTNKRPKIDNNQASDSLDGLMKHQRENRGSSSSPPAANPNANAASPINRMDTPESNCSDTQVDQETTKLWQALARFVPSLPLALVNI